MTKHSPGNTSSAELSTVKSVVDVFQCLVVAAQNVGNKANVEGLPGSVLDSLQGGSDTVRVGATPSVQACASTFSLKPIPLTFHCGSKQQCKTRGSSRGQSRAPKQQQLRRLSLGDPRSMQIGWCCWLTRESSWSSAYGRFDRAPRGSC